MEFGKQKIYKKHTAYFLVMCVLLLPNLSIAQVIGGQCSSRGYTIATINGVFTNGDGARGNMVALREKVGLVSNGQKIDYKYLLNPSHSILDLTDVAIQKTFEGVNMNDPDFVKILADASTQIKTQKVLLVAHSQGNFYANNFYKAVTDNGDVSAKSIGVYSVATPASYVAGDGIYRTSDTDTVINKARKVLPGTFLPANDSIDYLESDDSNRGHGFREIYLAYRGEEIKKEIEQSLSKLSLDPKRSENTLCINPPAGISTYQKITGNIAYPFDLTLALGSVGVNTAVNATVAIVTGIYDISTAILTSIGSAIASIATAGYNLIANTWTNASISGSSNMASVIDAVQNGPFLPSTAQYISKTPTISLSSGLNQASSTASANAPTDVIISTSTQTNLASFSPAVNQSPFSNLVLGAGILGGGAPPLPTPPSNNAIDTVIPQSASVSVENSTNTIVTTTVITKTVSSDGIIPVSPLNITLSSTTAIFSGTYTNNSEFDKIVFELKNTSATTATSTSVYAIATTTGKDISYRNEITLSGEGDWQYQARLEGGSIASSTSWSSLAFFSIATSTTIASSTTTTVATSTPDMIDLGYNIVASQLDRSMLDTTSTYVQGLQIQRNVVLKEPVTFTGAYKGDKGRIVAWYRFGYGQDCSTVKMVSLSSGFSSNISFIPVSATPNWDGSCVFRLNGSPNDSVTMPAQAYALSLYGYAEHSPAYIYGKAGGNENAVYCAGNEYYADSCPLFKGYSSNLSDFAYIITSDTYVPPPVPNGAKQVPDTMSPVVAEQADFSTVDVTPQPSSNVIQQNVVLSQRITFSGENAGNKGRLVVWHSFAPGQDCSTLRMVELTQGPGRDGTFLYPVSSTPGLDGSCVFHLGDPNASVTLQAGAYALSTGVSYYEGAPKILGKSGGNGKAVFCSGNDYYADKCDRFTRYSSNLSDFAYLITADEYANPTTLIPSSPSTASTTVNTTATTTVTATLDTTPPEITNYTLNGSASVVVVDFATTTPTVSLEITASEKVNWVSVKIEENNNPNNDKVFFSDSKGCKDETTVCSKSWNGILSGGVRAPDGTYRIKVNIKDTAGNAYHDYLYPYFIRINTASSTPAI